MCIPELGCISCLKVQDKIYIFIVYVLFVKIICPARNICAKYLHFLLQKMQRGEIIAFILFNSEHNLYKDATKLNLI